MPNKNVKPRRVETNVKKKYEKILTFRAGKFCLFENGNERILTLKEAADLRGLSDSTAKKIFAMVLNHRVPLTTPRLPPFLDAHQRAGVEWVLTRTRSYLAHPPGAGKTAQAIVSGVLACPPEGQVLFIVPPTLTVNWEREIHKFTGLLGLDGFPSISIVPPARDLHRMGWNADWVICSDAMLLNPIVLMHLLSRKWKLLAVDEASRFKEAGSLRTIALFGGSKTTGRGRKKRTFKSPGLIYRAKRIVLLDGSPMPNRAIELWAPTYKCDPEAIDFRSRESFGMRYGGPTQNDYGQYEFKRSSNEAELQEKIRARFMHVIPESALPTIERRRKIVYLNKDVRTKDMREWETNNVGRYDLSTMRDEDEDAELSTYLRELGMRKARLVIDYVLERLENKKEHILLFAWHRDVVMELEKALRGKGFGLVLGGTRGDEREKIFEAFQRGRLRGIVGNIAAMGRGHNLPAADRVIFAEYAWNDETNAQAEKRAARRGRKNNAPVACDYLVLPDSLDEVKLKTVFRKARMVERVIGE